MRKIWGLLILTLAFACNNNQQPKTLDDILNSVDKTNLNKGSQNFHLDTPEGWKSEWRTAQGVDFYYMYSPQTSEVPNPNINIVTESMQGTSLKTYLSHSLSFVAHLYPGAKVVAEGDIEANGVHGGWYNIKMEFQGTKGDLMAYVFPSNGVAYVITALCPPNKKSKYRLIFDKVAKSFKVNE